MSLLTVVRAAVKVADTVLKPLEATVTYQHYQAPTDGYGSDNLAAGVSMRAVVEKKQRQVRTASGVLTVSSITITLIDIAAIVAATAGAGISERGRFTLPDGSTQPTLSTGGLIDAGTGVLIATEVYI